MKNKIFETGKMMSHLIQRGPKQWDLHRLDGPAVWHPDHEGMELFYIHGKLYSKEEYWKHPLVKSFCKLTTDEDRENFQRLIKT